MCVSRAVRHGWAQARVRPSLRCGLHPLSKAPRESRPQRCRSRSRHADASRRTSSSASARPPSQAPAWLERRRRLRALGVRVSSAVLALASAAAIALDEQWDKRSVIGVSVAVIAAAAAAAAAADSVRLGRGEVVDEDGTDDDEELYDVDAATALRRSLVVRETKDGRGDGVFATERIQSGAVIGDYEGDLLDEKGFWERYPRGVGEYCIAVGDRWTIDGVNEAASGSAERRFATALINHSSRRPNLKRRTYERRRRVVLLAQRDIEAGGELLFDYGEMYWRGRRHEIIDSED